MILDGYHGNYQLDGFEYVMISNAYPMITFGGWDLPSTVKIIAKLESFVLDIQDTLWLFNVAMV